MRKRTILITCTLLLMVGGGIVSVRGVLPNTSPTSLSVQTTALDIQILNVIPAIDYQPGTSSPVATGVGVNINEPPGMPVNLTAGFSFAPHQGFLGVNTVVLTVVYSGGAGGYNGFQVSLNNHPRTVVTGTTVQNTATGSLPARDIKNGSNIIDVGLSPTSPTQLASTYIYQVRVTVEYTFLG